MDLKSMTNSEFTLRFKAAVTEERRITAEVLSFFREAERRMLYAEAGYPSLLAYAVQELNYSEPAAYRRIAAMRLLRDVPEAAPKVASGALSLTTLTRAATFLRQSEKIDGRKKSIEEKSEVLKSLENLSARETERILVETYPEVQNQAPEKMRLVSGGATQLTTVLNADLMNKLDEIQNLLGRSMEIKELLKYLADAQLEVLRKAKGLLKTQRISQSEQPAGGAAQPAPKVSCQDLAPQADPDKADPNKTVTSLSSRKSAALKPLGIRAANRTQGRTYIPVGIRRTVWQRSRGQCQYVNPETGLRCEERRHLQIEHRVPVARGGGDTLENLEVLCATHNRFRALRTFGHRKMARHVPSLEDGKN